MFICVFDVFLDFFMIYVFGVFICVFDSFLYSFMKFHVLFSLWCVPAAHRRPQKKYDPGFVRHVISAKSTICKRFETYSLQIVHPPP